ncbi:MAG TPA: class I SAM-dependent methyltransferase [Ktedonobacteraceae bacterium]|nr:class I SAM-dependent methyltransferase [Ktedonobacteraceae bacterium]
MPTIDWNPALYDQKHAFVFQYGKGLLSLLEPRAGETILDLGCGTGHLTKAIAESGARVVGIDSSAEMIEQARQGYPGIEFQVADARNFSLPYTFDAVFSNATLHWIKEAEPVVEHISAALRPGGRFVAELGGKGNVANLMGALQQALQEVAGVSLEPGWYFPSIGEYTPLLEKHGLAVQSVVLFDRPTQLEEGEKGIRIWLQMFSPGVFRDIPPNVKERVLARIEELLRPQFFRDGHWFADYRRLRVVAYKEQ